MDIFIGMERGISNLLREQLIFNEALLDEDYPETFNIEEFKSLTTFNKRIKYCQEHLIRISSGSARIVYKIDNQKVLKLAKNNKGIGQNETEIDLSSAGSYSKVVARIFDHHPSYLWVEMELARPVKLADFKSEFGYGLDVILDYLTYIYYSEISPSKGDASFYELPPDVLARLENHEFINKVTQMMNDYEINPSDYGKKSSYGLVQRDGKNKIILIDYGLTDNVYDSYYA